MSRIQPLLCTCARPAPSHASVARLVPPSTFVRSRAIHAPAAVVPAKRIPKPRGKRSQASSTTLSRSARVGRSARWPSIPVPFSSTFLPCSFLTPFRRAEPFHTPAAVLAASKRNLGQYADKFENWAALFSKTSAQLRDEVGMQVKESRYLLWLLEKYRQGHNPDAVAVPPTPKKTIRGWGPRIQNGKRVR
ncbi:SPOSA6832_04348, partial [Sporobolomyces salmonicolor]